MGFIRRYTLKNKLRESAPDEQCEVCNSNDIVFLFNNDRQIVKLFCNSCEHIFSKKLNRNLQRATELFTYDQSNHRISGQQSLIELLVKYAGVSKGNFLDFGVGGNYQAVIEMQNMYPSHNFMACDLYEREAKNYFTMYHENSPLGCFDGISSNAVIEHLDNTKEAWLYLNRLLKPIEKGGGVMLHAFPSQLIEDLNHWALTIGSHECLFSRRSLQYMCDYAGFSLLKIKFHSNIEHPVYYFRKIADKCNQ